MDSRYRKPDVKTLSRRLTIVENDLADTKAKLKAVTERLQLYEKLKLIDPSEIDLSYDAGDSDNKFVLMMTDDGKINPKCFQFLDLETIMDTTLIIESPKSRRKITRIMAIKSFGNVPAGTIGGFVEFETNLSQKGNCWVDYTSMLLDDSIVMNDAQILNESVIKGTASIYDDAVIDHSSVAGKCIISDNASIKNESEVTGNVHIGSNVLISSSMVEGEGKICVPSPNSIDISDTGIKAHPNNTFDLTYDGETEYGCMIIPEYRIYRGKLEVKSYK